MMPPHFARAIPSLVPDLAGSSSPQRRSTLSRRTFLATTGLAAIAVQGRTQGAFAAATPVARRAIRSDRVVDSWGINTHFNWQHGVWGEEVFATDLLIELGVRHIRGFVAPRLKAQQYALQRLAASGCRLEAQMAARVDGDTLATARAAVNYRLDEIVNFYGGWNSGVFSALEGCNEPNNDGVAEATWVSQTRNITQAVWEESKKRPSSAPIPVVGPGIARQVAPGGDAPTPEHDFAVLGDLSPWVDYGNIHVYPRGNAPSDEIDRVMAAARQAYPGGEIYHTTEGGYFNAMNYTATVNPPTPEAVSAVYAPRHLLEHVLRKNHRFFTYELLDDPNPNNDARENNFGYIRTPSLDPSTWVRKPAYYAMKNLLALYADPGIKVTPVDLPMALSGGGSDFRSVLVQKRAGQYLLAIWRDIDIYKWDRFSCTGAMLPITPATITLDLATAAPLSVFQPTQSPDAVSSYAASTSLQLPLSGEVVVVQIG